MAQVKLALVAAALLALVAAALAAPAQHTEYPRAEAHAEAHAASESSSSSESSDSSGSSESREEHNRKPLPPLPARNVPVSNQDEQEEQEQDAGQPMGNAIPDHKESDLVPPYPKSVRPGEGDVVEQKVEPGQPWESHYKHGVAPAKLPALETDNAHSYRHSIIHPYGADLHV